jgi:hypothetical protein
VYQEYLSGIENLLKPAERVTTEPEAVVNLSLPRFS